MSSPVRYLSEHLSCVVLAVAGLLPSLAQSATSREKGQFQLCVAEALLLPSKAGGKAWDFGGSSSDAGAMSALLAVATGGSAAVLNNPVFKAGLSATSGPDPYVKVYLNNRLVVHTNVARDTIRGQWSPETVKSECFDNGPQPGKCNNCSKWLPAASFHEQVRIEVWESDLEKDDPVGSFIGPEVPSSAIGMKKFETGRFDETLGVTVSVLSKGIEVAENGPNSQNGSNAPTSVSPTQANSATTGVAKPAIAATKAPRQFTVVFKTTKGNMTVDVHREWAPIGVDRFYSLVKLGFYDGTAFFRVIPGKLAQAGVSGKPEVAASWRDAHIDDDPIDTGKASNKRGYVTLASTGRPNSRATEFFINSADSPELDRPGFAPIGRLRPESLTVLDTLNGEYGDGAPFGKGPKRGRIEAEGAAFLKREFPHLDYIISATIQHD